MAAKNSSKMLVWGLLALLILGLGGFGVTNLSGTVRSIGKVGDKEIPVDVYASALQQDIRAIEAQTGQALSFEQAQSFGLTENTLSRLIASAALDNEADRLGISIGDATLARQLQTIPAFQGLDGKFDREGYRAALDRNGLTEARFEDRLRDETARTILQAAIVSGGAMPAAYADTLANYIGERRSVTYATLGDDKLPEPLPEPDNETLIDYYNLHVKDYTEPEKKRITYAWLDPDMLVDAAAVDQQSLVDLYEQRRDEFDRPERRLVERLVYPDAAAAQAAKDKLDAGETDFETLVTDRGLSLMDIDMGDVTQERLGAAGPAVFAAETGDVVGPVDTDLGPALFRINGVLAAQKTSLEDASLMLREELAADAARREVERQMEPIEDLLAGGATLEELADETDMQLTTFDWYPGTSEGIANYDGFDAAAEALTKDDYPELKQLDDGGVYAMRLDEIVDPVAQPYEEVRDQVRGAWETAETMKRLTELAEQDKARLMESATFAGLGLETKTEESLSRNGAILGAPTDLVSRIYQMKEGEIIVAQGFGTVMILRLDAIVPPSDEDANTASMIASIREQASQSMNQDLYNAFAADIRTRAGVRLDQNALNAVHANFR